MIARQVIVRGRVQGVGYRDAMAEAADALGVTGWVRNRRDGTVEAWLQGEASDIERLLAWCRQGPPAASVSAVDARDVAADPMLGAFVRRRTE